MCLTTGQRQIPRIRRKGQPYASLEEWYGHDRWYDPVDLS